MLQQNISQSQQQLLSVDQRQSLQILAYTNQELDSFLTEEYLQNPLLDCRRDGQSEIIDSLDGITIPAGKRMTPTAAEISGQENLLLFVSRSSASSPQRIIQQRSGN